MAIIITCECGRRLQAKEEWAGNRVKCPACQRAIQIPLPGVPVLAVPHAPAGELPIAPPAGIPVDAQDENRDAPVKKQQPQPKLEVEPIVQAFHSKESEIQGATVSAIASHSPELSPVNASISTNTATRKTRRLPSAFAVLTALAIVALPMLLVGLSIPLGIFRFFESEKITIQPAVEISSNGKTRNAQTRLMRRLFVLSGRMVVWQSETNQHVVSGMWQSPGQTSGQVTTASVPRTFVGDDRPQLNFLGLYYNRARLPLPSDVLKLSRTEWVLPFGWMLFPALAILGSWAALFVVRRRGVTP